MWKKEDVATAFSAFHATEGSNCLELTVTNLVSENFTERKITHRISLALPKVSPPCSVGGGGLCDSVTRRAMPAVA
jgi:hypothetical protein